MRNKITHKRKNQLYAQEHTGPSTAGDSHLGKAAKISATMNVHHCLLCTQACRVGLNSGFRVL
jgi:hypothetical protein